MKVDDHGDEGARDGLDAAFALLRQIYPAKQIAATDDGQTALTALADHEADTDAVARAIEIYQELLNGIGSSGARPGVSLGDAMALSNAWRSLGALYRRAGRSELASPLDTQRLELWRQWERKLPNNPFVLRQIAETIGR